MSNLTIAVDDQLIKQARVRALQEGTSLSAKVREFLQAYVSQSHEALQKQRRDAAAALLAAMEQASAQATADGAEPERGPSVGSGRRTLRDGLYEGDFRGRDRTTTNPSDAA